MTGGRFAARLNGFASAWPGATRPTTAALIARAGTVAGLTDLDLNYPDHLAEDAAETLTRVADAGLRVSGVAMRYYADPAFRRGGFTHPDPAVRRRAIDLTRRGMDAARAADAPLLTVWPGQDGFDVAFQADYARLWDLFAEALAEVCAHDRGVDVSLEYKPDEPRAFSLLPDAATTLLMLAEVGAPNTGVTLDFAHALYAGEQPAAAAALIARRSRLLGLHLNDANGRRDDGLPVGSVHLHATLEVLREARRAGFAGPIYFDTFPDASGLDPVAECAANIALCRRLTAALDRLEGDNALAAALDAQDGVAGQRAVNAVLLG